MLEGLVECEGFWWNARGTDAGAVPSYRVAQVFWYLPYALVGGVPRLASLGGASSTFAPFSSSPNCGIQLWVLSQWLVAGDVPDLIRPLLACVEDLLLPHQCAVGRPAACEQIHKVFCVLAEHGPDLGFISLDLQSAYNSIRRGVCLTELEGCRPELSPCVR